MLVGEQLQLLMQDADINGITIYGDGAMTKLTAKSGLAIVALPVIIAVAKKVYTTTQ